MNRPGFEESPDIKQIQVVVKRGKNKQSSEVSAMKGCPSPRYNGTAIWLYNQVLYGSMLYWRKNWQPMHGCRLLSITIPGNKAAYTSPICFSLCFGAIKRVCVLSTCAQRVIKHKRAIIHGSFFLGRVLGNFSSPKGWSGLAVWLCINSVYQSISQSK